MKTRDIPGIRRQDQFYNRWLDRHEPPGICSSFGTLGAQRQATKFSVRYRRSRKGLALLTKYMTPGLIWM